MASSSSSSSFFPDVYAWLENLPLIPQWKADSMSMNLCPFSSIPSLKLSIKNYNSSFSLSICADYNLPLSLWNSKTFSPNPISKKLLDDHETVSLLFHNIIENVLSYSPNRSISSNLLRFPRSTYSENNFKDLFNFSFLSLTFIICIYEATSDLRSSCLSTLKDQSACPKSREVSKKLMRILGSNTEEQWMRSINLAITNWILELQGENAECPSSNCKTPSPLFSYSFSTYGLWKVQLYCPVISMLVEKSSSPSPDENLLFSLNYHQLEGVIQFNHKVIIQEKWIEVRVNTDNIRCDVMKLVTDKFMKERGAGTSEKHFPSRIALQITPTMQANIISISVSKSSENPTREIGTEKSIEASFEPPNPHMGINFTAAETMTISLKPWKFEQSVHGNTAILNWFLHDSVNGREVFSSKPSKFALLQPKAWFKHRYSNAHRPFTRQGGVVFAGDEYGESVSWKVDKACMGESMKWEIKGWIWLTYWPNKHRTLYTETRRLEFREIVYLTLV
ncbi:Vicilin-like antimicrobial peptides 2-2 [Olea europaea subsp. europaea]|uniref:Vicilin-like antimicrobial peptides 2-2 n=1 Tax=Olea europaea subsp. europaea TaxID=158383 RepID=A0A8S0RHI2_OLEEU|nr:Vicilin-like antimicrobial peptides 2-2 [Olea europaea subsp. europaea]